MVSLLIVSHSAKLAEGVHEFIIQVAGEVRIAAAGGMPDGSVGTNVERIVAGLKSVANNDGILVLVDLGSAVMNVELAIEMYADGPTRISNAPLVEGAYLAAIEAAAGGTLEEVSDAAMQARDFVKVHTS